MPYMQIALPIGLMLWLAIWPLRGHARVAHVAMTAGLTAALILWAQWLWPSAYAPLAIGVLLVLVIVLGRRRPVDRRKSRLLPGLLAALLALLATVLAGWLISHRLRPPATLDLTLPFATPAAVTEGGRAVPINRHRAVQDSDSPSLSGWRGLADAVTLWPIDHLGRPLTTAQPVTAPCGGTVASMGNDTRLGRYLVLICTDTWVVLSGMTQVSASGRVSVGQPVGEALDLTVHAQSPGTPAHLFSGTPVPISMNGTYPVRSWVMRP